MLEVLAKTPRRVNKRINKLISVIVPVYNASKYLDACISSICSQSYKDFELILVDDGSTDNSLEICRKYRLKDNRIIVVHQDNAGVSAARNAGLTLARGEYFCFVDSDDEIEPNLLEKLYTRMEETHSDLCICGFKNYSKKKISYFKAQEEELLGKKEIANFVAKHYLEWLVSSCWGKLYRNIPLQQSQQSQPKRFDPKISLGEDLKFNIEYFQSINKIVVIDECLYHYNNTKGSLTKSYKTGHFNAICDIYSTTLRFFSSLNSNTDIFDLKNINYKLFSFSISFMYQEIMSGKTIKESKRFISKICNESLVQKAICDLPKLPLSRKLYVAGIKHKDVFFLWCLSYLKSRTKMVGLRCL